MKTNSYSTPALEELDVIAQDIILADSGDSVSVEDFQDMGELL